MIKHLESHIAIRHLKEQIKEMENQISYTMLHDSKRWYQSAIDSMQERIKLYK